MSRLACLAAIAGLAGPLVLGAATSHPVLMPAAAAADASAGTRCEIRVYKRGGATTVEGVLYATAPLAGSFRLSANGASDSDQSGSYSASPTGATSLGELTLGPGSYAAHMTVKWNGGSTTCAQRVGS